MFDFVPDKNNMKWIVEMKKRLSIIGSSLTTFPLNFKKIPELAKLYDLITPKFEMSLISLMSNSISFDRQKLFLNEDVALVEQLLSEYEKDCLNDLIASNPDVLILDFFADVTFGVVRTDLGGFITNSHERYLQSSSFQELVTSEEYSLLDNFDIYEQLWKESLHRFMDFMAEYLPETKIIINGNKTIDSAPISEVNYRSKVWEGLIDFASTNYNLPVIDSSIYNFSMDDKLIYDDFAVKLTNLLYPKDEIKDSRDFSKIDSDLNLPLENNIYGWNLIQNPSFRNEGEYWTSLGSVYFDEDSTNINKGELTLYGNQQPMALFSILSAPILIGASPENPVVLELYFEVWVEDVFDIDIYHDHIFIARGFKEKLQTSYKDATQSLYNQQAKLLNLTSRKWKKIRKIITVTELYLRVGPYVKGKTTVKWRNLSLKHYRGDEK